MATQRDVAESIFRSMSRDIRARIDQTIIAEVLYGGYNSKVMQAAKEERTKKE